MTVDVVMGVNAPAQIAAGITINNWNMMTGTDQSRLFVQIAA
jgi:hypothetical protein